MRANGDDGVREPRRPVTTTRACLVQGWIWAWLGWVVGVLPIGIGMGWQWPAHGANTVEKWVSLDESPSRSGRFQVAPDGSRFYFAGREAFLVFDAQGRFIDRIYTPQGTTPRTLIPLPDGSFLSATASAAGRIARLRSDGSEAMVLVRKSRDARALRADQTSWTSPIGLAVDLKAGRMFALDVTSAEPGQLDPAWSRVAVFDLTGAFQKDLLKYDADAAGPNAELDPLRTWYDALAVDPARKRLYLLARRSGELWTVSYDGTIEAKLAIPGLGDGNGGVALRPDGTILVGCGRSLKLIRPVSGSGGGLKIEREWPVPSDLGAGGAAAVVDVQTDNAGRVYASLNAPEVLVLRWEADGRGPQVIGPRYLNVSVDFPDRAIEADPERPIPLPIRVEGRPRPSSDQVWRVWARPTDGSTPAWTALPVNRRGDTLWFWPVGLSGPVDLAVKLGNSPIDEARPDDDPHVRAVVTLIPKGATRSTSIVPVLGRWSYQQGEDIPIQLVRRDPKRNGPQRATLSLTRLDAGPHPPVLAKVAFGLDRLVAGIIPGGLTRRLVPGRYRLIVELEGHRAAPFDFDIAQDEPDSPLQRILYHEFEQQPITTTQPGLTGLPERRRRILDHVEATAALGFNRETDRLAFKLDPVVDPLASRRDQPALGVDLGPAGLPVAGALGLTDQGRWEPEFYLDRATAAGVVWDTQLLGHCEGVPIRPDMLARHAGSLQRIGQWLGRHPSFWGFNYHDELFFGGGLAAGWTAQDDALVARVAAEQFAGRPRADTLDYLLDQTYQRFNNAVRRAMPHASRTTTPMWQSPPVEGSYPPTVFRDMTESYTHFLSEGYLTPWYAPHSAALFRRPGLPLRAVFDNAHRDETGEGYLKNLAQMLTQAPQGIGVQHTNPLTQSRAAAALRAGNLLATTYGGLFAECPPRFRVAILSSRTQDLTERRLTKGTPHWERVYAAFCAATMAHRAPMVVYEEDVAAGRLRNQAGQPVVEAVWLVGQTQPLPEAVERGLAEFVAAGGRIVVDQDAKPRDGTITVAGSTSEFSQALAEGYAADSVFPLAFPILQRLARAVDAALGSPANPDQRRFDFRADDPFTAIGLYDGGAIRYAMLARESSPTTWDAGRHWSLGRRYSMSWTPGFTRLSLPPESEQTWSQLVTIDVFERRVVDPSQLESDLDNRRTLTVDLTTFPGRLYALVPGVPIAPEVVGQVVSGGGLAIRVQARVQDRHASAGSTESRPLAARVPIRIRLRSGHVNARELFRLTDSEGRFETILPLPIEGGPDGAAWELEVVELLTGRVTTLSVQGPPTIYPVVAGRNPVDWFRADRIAFLLDEATRDAERRVVTLVGPARLLNAARRRLLGDMLDAHGLTVRTAMEWPETPQPGLTVAVATTTDLLEETRPGNTRGDRNPVKIAWRKGLLGFDAGSDFPGPQRAAVTAALAPRIDREDAIIILGGDDQGLDRALETLNQVIGSSKEEQIGDRAGDQHAFVNLAHLSDRSTPPFGRVEQESILGKPRTDMEMMDEASDLPPTLSDLFGVRLEELAISPNGRHLAVSLAGTPPQLVIYRVDDESGPQLVRLESVGHGHAPVGIQIAPDGSWAAASNRDLAVFGEGLHLIELNQDGQWTRPRDLFAAFGDLGGHSRRHAVTPDGQTVIVTGTNGVVAWRAEEPGEGQPAVARWSEAWAIESWRAFDKMDWPVSDSANREAQFHAFAPPTGDLVYIVYGEMTNNQWITAERPCQTGVVAVDPRDGAARWRFEPAGPRALRFPKLHVAPLGTRLVLETQVGSWGTETFAYDLLDRDGRVLASWSSIAAPSALAVADSTGWTALATRDRMLELRDAQGHLRVSRRLPLPAIGLAFASDGQSVFVAHALGRLERLDRNGNVVWSRELPSAGPLVRAAESDRLIVACWDGRLRGFAEDGRPLWSKSVTEDLPRGEQAPSQPSANPAALVHRVVRPATASATLPDGPNLLSPAESPRPGDPTKAWAVLSVGGTPGWMSEGRLQISSEILTDGRADGLALGWFSLDELFWAASAARQPWVEIRFHAPTDVTSLTVYEDPQRPEAWPTDTVIQVWDEAANSWHTATRGLFLRSFIHTYALNLKGATRIRYVVLGNLYRNLHTCEIEVRGTPSPGSNPAK